MSGLVSDHYSSKPLKILTELDVVEAFARASYRGELAVLERFTPHMMQGALTKGALFQIAFHVEDSDMHNDKGLLYSAIVLHAAMLILQGDTAAWSELRTRPGKLGSFIAALSEPEGLVVKKDREPIRDAGVLRPRVLAETPIFDVVDIVCSRLHLNFETLEYLHAHLQEASTKAMIHMVLLMRGKEHVPGCT